MKFVIDGVEYSDTRAPSLLDLIDLQEQAGITVDDLQSAQDYLKQVKDSDRSALSDPKALKLVGASLWLARRAAGEQVSFREALAVPLDKIEFIDEEEDEEPAPDPQSPAEPAGAAADEEDVAGAVA